MADKQYTLKAGQKPTPAQIAEVKAAAKHAPVFDEDSPEFTEEQLLQFRRVSELRRSQKKQDQKQTISLRLSPQAIRKARSLGKGYTGVLSRIVENALNDPETIRNAM